MNAQLESTVRRAPAARVPRLGFLGLGWIGRQRMQVLRASGAAEVAAIADTQPAALEAAAGDAPEAARAASFDELFAHDLDGLVIATPSGAHAWQAIAALKRGVAVFCQKPLARTAAEAAQVVAAARRAGCLLEVDYSYRHLAGMAALREAIRAGELGELYAIDLVFHNAYGPDKPWFDDLAQSGGGCVMDLGIHLIDLVGWMSGASAADALDARLYAGGRALEPPPGCVEDYAVAHWRTDGGACVRLACSWRLQAGCDAVIEASFYGTRGGAALRNVGGSFYDFTLERFDGTRREQLAGPPDAWGGRALVRWAERLAAGEGYDEDCERLVDVHRIVDRIYGR
jgi:predicted dehydrogenase